MLGRASSLPLQVQLSVYPDQGRKMVSLATIPGSRELYLAAYASDHPLKVVLGKGQSG